MLLFLLNYLHYCISFLFVQILINIEIVHKLEWQSGLVLQGSPPTNYPKWALLIYCNRWFWTRSPHSPSDRDRSMIWTCDWCLVISLLSLRWQSEGFFTIFLSWETSWLWPVLLALRLRHWSVGIVSTRRRRDWSKLVPQLEWKKPRYFKSPREKTT